MTVSPSYMIQKPTFDSKLPLPTGPIPLNWYYNLVGFHWKSLPSFKAKAGYAQGLSSLPDLADASAWFWSHMMAIWHAKMDQGRLLMALAKARARQLASQCLFQHMWKCFEVGQIDRHIRVQVTDDQKQQVFSWGQFFQWQSISCDRPACLPRHFERAGQEPGQWIIQESDTAVA